MARTVIDRRMVMAATAALSSVAGIRSASAHSQASAAQQAFDQLVLLTGEWSGRYANGHAHRVSYRLTAGGTVLVETWAMSATRESLTLYFVDADELIAVHYCPHGTQPRLKLVRKDADGMMHFALDGGGNLAAAGRSHQDRFAIQVTDSDSFCRSEHYSKNGEPAADSDAADEFVTYARIPSGSQEIF